MQTITIWVLFQVLPFFQPVLLTASNQDCINNAAVVMEQRSAEGVVEEVVMFCSKVQVLVGEV